MKLRHQEGKPVGFRTKHRVDVESKAPDFTLPSQSGELVSLRGFLGRRPVVPGCTKEACAFRDGHEEFGKLDAEVVGVSSDSVGSHSSFVAKHDLPSRCSATSKVK